MRSRSSCVCRKARRGSRGRLIVEEGLECETADALGRQYYVRGAAAGASYRNGYRTGRLKTAEDMIEYAAPQISDRDVPAARDHPPPGRGTGGAGG
jgi:hypothetical protein